jgi:hypothetical protein
MLTASPSDAESMKGKRLGLISDEHKRLRRLVPENRDLHRANEIPTEADHMWPKLEQTLWRGRDTVLFVEYHNRVLTPFLSSVPIGLRRPPGKDSWSIESLE